MASPPAVHYNPIANTKKRPSISSSVSGTASKRPRLSHPLRQTSFPASDAAGYYASAGPPSARSETGSINASVISTTSTNKPAPRGRGRPRKSTTIQAESIHGAGDTLSPQDGAGRGKAGGARSVVSAHQNDADGGAGDEDEDDALDMARFTGTHTDADREADENATIRLDKLKSALDSDQMARLERWRAVAFPKRTVQKLVNQIVSQSVTEAPINAVKVYAKWYAAEIVERAREVQSEWATAYEKTREDEKTARDEKLAGLRDRIKKEEDKPEDERMSEYDRRRFVQQLERVREDAEKYIPNPHRGGLLPDHLREALRRYKSDGEGGGIGFEGLSHPLLGIHGSRTWSQGDGSVGRRLFR